jgi:hypothetical protein
VVVNEGNQCWSSNVGFRTPDVDGLSPFMVKLAMVNTIALLTLPSGYD